MLCQTNLLTSLCSGQYFGVIVCVKLPEVYVRFSSVCQAFSLSICTVNFPLKSWCNLFLTCKSSYVQQSNDNETLAVLRGQHLLVSESGYIEDPLPTVGVNVCSNSYANY